MNSLDFSKLSLNEQCQYIWDNGVHLDKREYYNQTLILYSVGKYFYEVWYRKSKNEIVKVTEPDLERVSKFYGMELY